MVALRCIALQNDPDIDDKKICRAYFKGDRFHVVGGVMSSTWQERNRVLRLNCAKCRRFGRDVCAGDSCAG